MEWDSEYISIALENLWDGICVFDAHNTIRYWNRAACEFSGYETDDVLGIEDWANIFRAPNTALSYPNQYRLMRHKDGRSIPVLVRVILKTGPNGDSQGGILIFTTKAIGPISEERRPVEISDKPPLVCARRDGEMRIHGKLDEMRRYGTDFGLMIVQINTARCSSEPGDSTLIDVTIKSIGHRITKLIRASDLVCQWDSDKLSVVMLYLTQSELRIVADRILSAIERFSWSPSGQSVPLTVSIGATLSNPNDNLHSLIERAELLLREAAKTGDNVIKTDTEPN